MSLREWWHDVTHRPHGPDSPGVPASRAGWDGTRGLPPSGNGASSFHAFWEAPSGSWTGAEATLTITEPPHLDRLWFWALQVTFLDRGRPAGGAHLGLQWCPGPLGPAVNWGGYAPAGGELRGSASALPSAWGNPNTRDYRWEPDRPYRLRVRRVPEGWRGEVDDVVAGTTTVVRDLHAAGEAIGSPMVWSEVFAACDDPPTEVRWSGLALTGPTGATVEVRAVTLGYQEIAEGGCITTETSTEGADLRQRTGTVRTNRAGQRLTLGPGV